LSLKVQAFKSFAVLQSPDSFAILIQLGLLRPLVPACHIPFFLPSLPVVWLVIDIV
jgi:hypothetical protein